MVRRELPRFGALRRFLRATASFVLRESPEAPPPRLPIDVE